MLLYYLITWDSDNSCAWQGYNFPAERIILVLSLCLWFGVGPEILLAITSIKLSEAIRNSGCSTLHISQLCQTQLTAVVHGINLSLKKLQRKKNHKRDPHDFTIRKEERMMVRCHNYSKFAWKVVPFHAPPILSKKEKKHTKGLCPPFLPSSPGLRCALSWNSTLMNWKLSRKKKKNIFQPDQFLHLIQWMHKQW